MNRWSMPTVFRMNGLMVLRRFKEGEELSERALMARLRHFVEDSDLSFYKIASRVGTSGTMLSMWLAGTARPQQGELAEIGKLLD
jgi:hypothetical protein